MISAELYAALAEILAQDEAEQEAAAEPEIEQLIAAFGRLESWSYFDDQNRYIDVHDNR